MPLTLKTINAQLAKQGFRGRRYRESIQDHEPVTLLLMPTDTHAALLRHALIGYEERKAEIAETIASIRATLDGKAPTNATAPTEPTHAPAPRRKRGTMSTAARKRMALMMKQRWAKAKRSGKRSLR